MKEAEVQKKDIPPMGKSIMRFCAKIAAYSWAICCNVSVALQGNLAGKAERNKYCDSR